MLEVNSTSAQDLPQLMDLLTNVVTTLDAVGADGYSDVLVYVAGCRNGRMMGELSLERGDMWVSTRTSDTPRPGYVRADNSSDRRALLTAELVYLMWHWRWETPAVAAALGIGAQVLDGWIKQAAAGNGDGGIPPVIAQRVRRLLVVEQIRLIAGIEDAAVHGWLRDARAAFGGRSILDLLGTDGEPGFRRVLLLMLNSVAATSDTIH